MWCPAAHERPVTVLMLHWLRILFFLYSILRKGCWVSLKYFFCSKCLKKAQVLTGWIQIKYNAGTDLRMLKHGGFYMFASKSKT